MLFQALELRLRRLVRGLNVLEGEAGALDHFVPDWLRQGLAALHRSITWVRSSCNQL